MLKKLSPLLIVLLCGCSKPLPHFKNLDLAAWENDKNGCSRYREQQFEVFNQQKEKLLALKELQIVELLGKPDRNELYKRNQKFYYYYLLPSPDCGIDSLAKASRLAVRFNAMGLAKEVIIE
jgi:hypothetical protein